ncbi:MAG: hypothetical protein ACXVKL_17840, partial [Candidatus Angelobacter sp.]
MTTVERDEMNALLCPVSFPPAQPEADCQLEEDHADRVQKNIPQTGGARRKKALMKFVQAASG